MRNLCILICCDCERFQWHVYVYDDVKLVLLWALIEQLFP